MRNAKNGRNGRDIVSQLASSKEGMEELRGQKYAEVFKLINDNRKNTDTAEALGLMDRIARDEKPG